MRLFHVATAAAAVGVLVGWLAAERLDDALVEVVYRLADVGITLTSD